MSIVLLATTVAVSLEVYRLWEQEPWDLSGPAKSRAAPLTREEGKRLAGPQAADARVIVEKNLFDPERGAGQAQEGASSSIALERIRSLVLVGTAIFDDARYAILRESATPRPAGPRTQAVSFPTLRLKQGDRLDGFTLAEVHEHRVVFTSGASRVEVGMDFSRTVEEPRRRPPLPTPPRPAPAFGIPRQPGESAPVPRLNP